MDKQVTTKDSSRYAQRWIDNIDQTDDPATVEQEHEQGLATRLHLACLKVFRLLCHQNLTGTRENNVRPSQTSKTSEAQLPPLSIATKKYQCPCCPDSFNRQSVFKLHLLAHFDDTVRDYDPDCYESFHLHNCSRQPRHQWPNNQSMYSLTNPGIHAPGRRVSASHNTALKEQLGKFYLWGEGFRDGSLDRATDRSSDLRSIILELLHAIAKELLYSKSLVS